MEYGGDSLALVRVDLWLVLGDPSLTPAFHYSLTPLDFIPASPG